MSALLVAQLQQDGRRWWEAAPRPASLVCVHSSKHVTLSQASRRQGPTLNWSSALHVLAKIKSFHERKIKHVFLGHGSENASVTNTLCSILKAHLVNNSRCNWHTRDSPCTSRLHDPSSQTFRDAQGCVYKCCCLKHLQCFKCYNAHMWKLSTGFSYQREPPKPQRLC